MRNKTKFGLLTAGAAALCLCIVAGSGTIAAKAAYPTVSEVNEEYVRVEISEISRLEVSELQGNYPYFWANQHELNWVEYCLEELTVDGTANDIAAQNGGDWVTRGNNSYSTSWVRYYFNASKKIKQFVLYTPNLESAPNSFYFLYSQDATYSDYASNGAALTSADEFAWQNSGNGTWATVQSFSSTGWKEESVTTTRNDGVQWQGYVNVVTFDKAVEAKALKLVMSKDRQAIRLSMTQLYKLADNDTQSAVYEGDEFYTYNFDYEAATQYDFNDETGAENLNDGISGDLFAAANVRYGRWLSKEYDESAHMIQIDDTKSSLNIAGVALHVDANKTYFPKEIRFLYPDGDAWTELDAYTDYAVTDDGWQYFIFPAPLSGKSFRIVFPEKKVLGIAEMVVLQTSKQAKTVSGVELEEGTVPRTLSYGAALALENLPLKVSFSDGTTENVRITKRMIVSGLDENKIGEQTLAIYYGGKTLNYTVEVIDDTPVVQILVRSMKTEYKIGEELDLTGAKLGTLTEAGIVGETAITADMVSGFDASEAGTVTLTITYGGQSITQEITVSDYLVSIAAELARTEYKVGDALDLAGAGITLHYASGKTEEISMAADMVSGFDTSKAGTVTLTVTYEGKTCELEIGVTGISPNTSEETSEGGSSGAGNSDGISASDITSVPNAGCGSFVNAGLPLVAFVGLAFVAAKRKKNR